MQIDIKGHSGCSIDITEENGQLFVRKSSKDKKYLDRLYLQGEKQANDKSADESGIEVPLIYKLEKNDNEAFILMDYIYAKNFVDFFEHATPDDIDNFIDKFINYINSEFCKCKMQKVSRKIFIKKFESVYDNCQKNHLLNNAYVRERVNKMLGKARSAFLMLPEELELPVGICHGDLTFSNILFTSNKMYFIDYLDSFIETPIQDIVKLRQDTCYGWSLLMYDKRYDPVRIKMIFKYIDSKINSYYEEHDGIYRLYYEKFQLMNILRILPYVKEERVRDFLMDKLEWMVENYPETKIVSFDEI